jgi:heptosyltransferase II
LIIFIQTAFLGDLILSIPAILRIKKNFPNTKVGIVCKTGLGGFLLRYQICDEIFEVEKGRRESYKAILKRINGFSVQAVFCFHRSFRSQLLALQINSLKKYGFKSLLNRFVLNATADYIYEWPDVIRYMSLAGIVDQEVKSSLENPSQNDFEKFNFKDKQGRFLAIPDLFRFQNQLPAKAVNSKKVVVFPGSVWATKKWTQAGFVDLLKLLKEKDVQVYLLGSPQEKKICQEISERAGFGLIRAGDFSIEQSIEFLSDAGFIVCNDSASAHMAAFVNRPAVVIFGPTTLELGFRPWNDESRVVEANLDCRPCGAHGHDRCPLGHHHCMQMIKPNDVLSEILASGLLNKFSN